jgi:hypothetical protein
MGTGHTPWNRRGENWDALTYTLGASAAIVILVAFVVDWWF